MKKQRRSLLCVAVIFACAAHSLAAQAESTERSSSWLVLSHAEYLDRVRAIWTAQMIAQMTGVRFEHQPASTIPSTPMTQLPGYAPVHDDYYYEMVALRAFEKYGIELTVQEWATVAGEPRRLLGLQRTGFVAVEARTRATRHRSSMAGNSSGKASSLWSHFVARISVDER